MATQTIVAAVLIIGAIPFVLSGKNVAKYPMWVGIALAAGQLAGITVIS